jgi:hypothetical protein
MFDVFRRSYGIFRQSLAVLANDKEILLFPLLSGISMLFVFAGMVGGGWFLGLFRVLVESDESGSGRVLAYAVLFFWYFASWFVTLFFNVAVIHCAKTRLDGGDPTVRDGLHAAWSHLGRIAAWAAISATVGILARIAREKGGLLLKIFAWIGEVAWAIATFFIVPVMIFERRSLVDSIKQSSSLMRKTWGEALVGSGGIGLFVFLLALAGFVPVVLGFLAGSAAALAVGVAVAAVWWLVLTCLSSALTGVYRAALYVYATENRVPAGFAPEAVQRAFHPK